MINAILRREAPKNLVVGRKLYCKLGNEILRFTEPGLSKAEGFRSG